MFRQPVLFWSGNISRAWGTGLVIIGGVFVEMDDGFVFSRWIHLSIDFFFFGSNYLRFIIRGQGGETVNGRQYLRPVWRNRE